MLRGRPELKLNADEDAKPVPAKVEPPEISNGASRTEIDAAEEAFEAEKIAAEQAAAAAKSGGLAQWSGTSFSAPAVAAAIAHAAVENEIGTLTERLKKATEDTVYDPALLRLPGLGTVVNVT